MCPVALIMLYKLTSTYAIAIQCTEVSKFNSNIWLMCRSSVQPYVIKICQWLMCSSLRFSVPIKLTSHRSKVFLRWNISLYPIYIYISYKKCFLKNSVKSFLTRFSGFYRLSFMVFNATFNNILVILWRSVLLVEEVGVPKENHRPVSSHCQTWSLNVVSSTPCYHRDSNSQLLWW